MADQPDAEIPFEDKPVSTATAPVVAVAQEGLTTDEQITLGALVAKRAAAAATGAPPVRLKVGPPHSSMTFGGTTVDSEFTDVPAHLAAAITQAAADAGVTLIPEG